MSAQAAHPEALRARLGRRTSNAATAIPLRKSRRQGTRRTARTAAPRDWRSWSPSRGTRET